MRHKFRNMGQVDWEWEAGAKKLGIDPSLFAKALHDGRVASFLLGLYFASVYKRVEDGKSGFLFERQDKTYRLRIIADKVELNPSINRGAERRLILRSLAEEEALIDGFLIVFTEQMPCPCVYELDLAGMHELIEAEVLDYKWCGKPALFKEKQMANTVMG